MQLSCISQVVAVETLKIELDGFKICEEKPNEYDRSVFHRLRDAYL